ncbi:YdcF family protein [Pseudarthrobacter sp. J1738]|uniref:YdcF family protein n=1 Tax=Pseudarthrobacter sp. J1738 TaxID=3420446 RepID=UPI003D2A893C
MARAWERTLLRVGIAVLLCTFLWLFVAARLFVFVPQGHPGKVDAVIVLGGRSDERLPAGMKLQESTGAPMLVLSKTGLLGNVEADMLCDTRSNPSSSFECFTAVPLNTRGEAEAISELVRVHGWKHIAVVTSKYHVTRSGELLRQCTVADVTMVYSEPSLGVLGWAWRLVVESAGTVDVMMRPECDSPR